MKHRLFKVLVVGTLMATSAIAAVLYLHYMAYYMNRDGCAANLREIGGAISLYADDHGGHFPDSLSTLVLNEYLRPIVLVCPNTADTATTGPTTQATSENLVHGGHLSYIYVGRELTRQTVRDNTVVAFEPLSNHRDGMHVLFGDGHNEFLDATQGKMIESEAAAGLQHIVITTQP